MSNDKNKKRCPLKFRNPGGDRYCQPECAWFDGVGCGLLDISINTMGSNQVADAKEQKVSGLIDKFIRALQEIKG